MKFVYKNRFLSATLGSKATRKAHFMQCNFDAHNELNTDTGSEYKPMFFAQHASDRQADWSDVYENSLYSDEKNDLTTQLRTRVAELQPYVIAVFGLRSHESKSCYLPVDYTESQFSEAVLQILLLAEQHSTKLKASGLPVKWTRATRVLLARYNEVVLTSLPGKDSGTISTQTYENLSDALYAYSLYSPVIPSGIWRDTAPIYVRFMKKLLAFLVVGLTMFYLPYNEYSVLEDIDSVESVNVLGNGQRVSEKLLALELTPGNLIKILDFYGVKSPDVVYQQAVLESANFSSYLYRKNSNLFGMYNPGRGRPTTSLGPCSYGYATYEHWTKSVQDYKMWQDMSSLDTEDYYTYLVKRGYAESKVYVQRLRSIRVPRHT